MKKKGLQRNCQAGKGPTSLTKDPAAHEDALMQERISLLSRSGQNKWLQLCALLAPSHPGFRIIWRAPLELWPYLRPHPLSCTVLVSEYNLQYEVLCPGAGPPPPSHAISVPVLLFLTMAIIATEWHGRQKKPPPLYGDCLYE